MRPTRGRIVVITTLRQFDARLAAGARHLVGWRITHLDLRERSAALAGCDVSRTTFVGCRFAPGDEEWIRAAGALVLPGVGEPPVTVRRDALYTAEELFDTRPYADSLDARAYAWSQGSRDADATMARVLHDQYVDTALDDWRAERRLVGVMGGHAAQRGDATYAAAAELGRLLGATLTVATGGGPGAMEAANLGALMARADAAAVAETVRRLGAVPSFRPSIDAWADLAREVADAVPDPVENLGVPTWHYGHEPPNVFATAIAKYFRNALRESILLEVCDGGIVFLPGAAGTVQEVFQDACENYYAAEHAVAPMILVGRTYWTETLPAWPLLRALARGRAMQPHVHLVDDVAEAAALLA